MHFFSLLVGKSGGEDQIESISALGIILNYFSNLALEILVRVRRPEALAIKNGLSRNGL